MHNLADQLLVNGRIYTMDAKRPLVSTLAIAGGQVLAVGDPCGMLAPGGKVLDL